MISRISLVTLCQHTKMLQLLTIFSPVYFIPATHLFWNWKFVLLHLSHLLLSFPLCQPTVFCVFNSVSVHSFFYISCISEIIQYLSFSVRLISFSIIPYSSFMAQMARLIPSYGWVIFHWICMSHLLYSSLDEHLSCFHVLGIVDSVAVNIEMCVSFLLSTFVFFG